MQSNNIQTTGDGRGVKIVESRNMLETGEETGEGQDVTKSWSSTSSEQEGAIEVREGSDVGNSLSSMSEEEGAAEMGEGREVGNSSLSMSFECEVQNDVDTEEKTDVGELL